MSMKKFVGIDYSLAGPAVVVIDGEPSFYYLTEKKKFVGPIKHNLFGTQYPEYMCESDRYDRICSWVLNIMEKHNISASDSIYIEGYSFGSSGSSLAQIHENCGVLKYELFKGGYTYNTVPPTSVKKFATGKGNAKKDQMCQQFIDDTGIKLHEEFGSKKIDSKPAQDLVDAYYIAKWGQAQSALASPVEAV
jgi:Holliday junction resolvasome RuvABC endonuclease subunit